MSCTSACGRGSGCMGSVVGRGHRGMARGRGARRSRSRARTAVVTLRVLAAPKRVAPAGRGCVPHTRIEKPFRRQLVTMNVRGRGSGWRSRGSGAVLPRAHHTQVGAAKKRIIDLIGHRRATSHEPRAGRARDRFELVSTGCKPLRMGPARAVCTLGKPCKDSEGLSAAGVPFCTSPCSWSTASQRLPPRVTHDCIFTFELESLGKQGRAPVDALVDLRCRCARHFCVLCARVVL